MKERNRRRQEKENPKRRKEEKQDGEYLEKNLWRTRWA
jgi:hypothetical protein